MTERDDINYMLRCIHSHIKTKYDRKLKMRKNIIEDKIRVIGSEIFNDLGNEYNNLSASIESNVFNQGIKDEILSRLDTKIAFYNNNITNTDIANINNIGNKDMNKISNFFDNNIFENYVANLNLSINSDISIVQILEFQLYILNDLKTKCQKYRDYYDSKNRSTGESIYAWIIGFFEALLTWATYSNIACQYDLFVTNTLSMYENRIKTTRKNLLDSINQLNLIRNLVSNLGNNNELNSKRLNAYIRYKGHYGHLMGIQG